MVADTAVGAATADLGVQIRRSANDFVDLATRAKDLVDRKNAFVGMKEAERYQQTVRRKLLDRRAEADIEAKGLSDEMQDFVAKTEASINARLPDTQRPVFAAESKLARDVLQFDIAAAEHEEDRAYFVAGIEETRELAVNDVLTTPGRIDQVFSHFKGLVETAPLPQHMKRKALEEADQRLHEAWVKGQPLDVQISGLTDIGSRQIAQASPGQPGANKKSPSEGPDAEFFARASILPERQRNRLLMDAIRKKVAVVTEEADGIAVRVDTAHEDVDPVALKGNPFLGTETKLQLLDRYSDATSHHAQELAAVGWTASAGMADPLDQDDQRRADLAFSHLFSSGADANALARGFLHSKGMLPNQYEKILVKDLAGTQVADIAQALKSVSVRKQFADRSRLDWGSTELLQNMSVRQEVLQRQFGMTVDELATQLATANRPQARKERETDFSAFSMPNTALTFNAASLLDRL
ncbi:hypothetical protein [Roseibium sp. MMSF_3544]|uniref:hypothetical protein n=1 Tax=unclassified Roseibium TaxID=2629323 RepID=UPI00273FFABA|nr:hypothetical protein [Roseibium sp. MMSF_3544]